MSASTTSNTSSTIAHPPSSSSTTDDSTPSTTHATATSTSAHPPSTDRDPTLQAPEHPADDAEGGLAAAAPPRAAELARLKVALRRGLRQYPDFPTPGVLFEDILPLFARPDLHAGLIRALELLLATSFPSSASTVPPPPPPSSSASSLTTSAGEGSRGGPVGSAAPRGVDVILGLESRGFLFGPTLAWKLGASFVAVRKKGKLPGPTETEAFQKEYGSDFFQIQRDAIAPGQRVVIMDDIIATGT